MKDVNPTTSRVLTGFFPEDPQRYGSFNGFSRVYGTTAKTCWFGPTTTCNDGFGPSIDVLQPRCPVNALVVNGQKHHFTGINVSPDPNGNQFVFRCRATFPKIRLDPPPLSCPAGPNPVFGETGLKRQVETDYSSPGSRLAYQRVWRSDRSVFFGPNDERFVPGAGSPGNAAVAPRYFTGQFQGIDAAGQTVLRAYAFAYSNADQPYTVLHAADGNHYEYTDNGSALTPASTDINHRVTRTVGAGGAVTHTVVTDDDVLTQYGPDGLPTAKRWPNGESITYAYSTAGTPASVAPRANLLLAMTDHNGRSLSLAYDAEGNVKSLTDPAGGVTQYAYDESSGNCPAGLAGGRCMRLTSVTYPDGKVRRYHYNEATHVDTALEATTAYLTGITDENGQRLSNYRYNAQGQAVSTGRGGFDYQLAYAANATTVTDPLGAQRVTTYQEVLGRKYPVSQSQPGGSGCAAASSAAGYDTRGNKTSEDDFTGKRACHAYDPARNLPTARVEGLAAGANCGPLLVANAALPAGSRKVSTLWHPVWRLPSRVAEPHRITTRVYNGQPDPTENGPRTDVSDLTTYTYHTATAFTGANPNAVGTTVGDLKTVTNAAGRVTQYAKYDKHGRLLESTDANGAVTTHAYDARQRLSSTTVAGLTTSYGYDAAGQLKRVTRPDNTSWTGYDYDTAHRLVSVRDNLGNRIDYTLDALGNRTAENVKDPGGLLRRQLTRSIDPLGRVQQTTGLE